MFRLTCPTLNGKPLPGILEQATVSMAALEPWIPAPSHDRFGIAIVRPWVAPTLLRLADRMWLPDYQFDPLDYQLFVQRTLVAMADHFGLPREFVLAGYYGHSSWREKGLS